MARAHCNQPSGFRADAINVLNQSSCFAFKPAKFRRRAEKIALQRQIEATDKQIDQLVYELYGLTGEEIKIVEGGTK